MVSTKLGNRYLSIQNRELLQELAKRVKNVRGDYVETYSSEKIVPPNIPQPQCKDLELLAKTESLMFSEQKLDPK